MYEKILNINSVESTETVGSFKQVDSLIEKLSLWMLNVGVWVENKFGAVEFLNANWAEKFVLNCFEPQIPNMYIHNLENYTKKLRNSQPYLWTIN